MARAVVTGVGHAVPETIVTNHDIAKLVDTNDAWIQQRTGIRERRVCRDDETTSMLATKAGREAMEAAGLTPDDIDLVVVATVTQDMLFPATACLVQDALGIRNAGAFDLGAACAGFICSLSAVGAMVEAGRVKHGLVIGVDTLTKFVDWTDRSTCILFGDGAGAVVLEPSDDPNAGLIDTVLLADGSGGKHINLEVGGTLHPVCKPGWENYRTTLYMAGAEVYRFAVTAMGDACNRLLERAGMTSQDIDLFVPHQANLRIITSAADRLNLPPEKVFINVDRYGNTSGGSIPLALYEAVHEGRLKPGMLVMTVGFGAGLVWGANLIRW